MQPLPDLTTDQPEDYVQLEPNFTKRWIPENKFVFSSSFDENEIFELNKHICDLNSLQVDQNTLDSISDKLGKIFISTAQKAGMCKHAKKSNRKPRKHPNKPWFDRECESQRDKYLDFKNSLIKHTFDRKQQKENQAAIARECNNYKKFIKKHKQAYLKNLHTSLRKLKTKDAREYWKIINPSNQNIKKPCNISINSLKTHFENLNKLHNNGHTSFDPLTIDHSINEQINKRFFIF